VKTGHECTAPEIRTTLTWSRECCPARAAGRCGQGRPWSQNESIQRRSRAEFHDIHQASVRPTRHRHSADHDAGISYCGKSVHSFYRPANALAHGLADRRCSGSRHRNISGTSPGHIARRVCGASSRTGYVTRGVNDKAGGGSDGHKTRRTIRTNRPAAKCRRRHCLPAGYFARRHERCSGADRY